MFLPRKMSAFISAAYIVMHFRLDFFMEANMNPDQTAPLGPYCLQYRQPKNISRGVEQTTKVLTIWLTVNIIKKMWIGHCVY